MSGKSMKLSFKGDKKVKKTKRARETGGSDDEGGGSSSSKHKSKKRAEIADPGAWVFPEDPTEVTGPTFIWAPTDPPSCISYDAIRSRVIPVALPPPSPSQQSDSSSSFPPALSYEPQGIDSVWVVSKLSGATVINLRTASGMFLGCDRFGVVSAISESRGQLESFTPHILESNLLALETTHGTFLSISETATGSFTLRGDSPTIGFAESFRCKVQAGFREKARIEAEEGGAKGKGKRVMEEELDEVALTKLRHTYGGGKLVVSAESKRELKKAREEGRLSEALLDRRSKLKSDKFC
ncbi:FRG1-like family-domain-containing protein [Mrakia frigida]|uniref:FRG1-like family-domain-containing protein n=1 Tax=Mrakia frigida TaxID=29902 RepID=UPI003FCC00C5